jgi:hypothetical protein
VRRADRATLTRDLATLQRHPVLDTLHPGLKQRLQRLAARPNRRELYGLPYSVAYADRMVRAFGLLNEAADAVEDGGRGIRPLPAQPRPRPAQRRLRVGRCGLDHRPLQEFERADRRLRDL